MVRVLSLLINFKKLSKKSFAGTKKVVCLQPLKTGTFLGSSQAFY
tara:strand:- start:120 stop:254 length:135 start_codon:yes stop_codon:yes gene_type:complete